MKTKLQKRTEAYQRIKKEITGIEKLPKFQKNENRLTYLKNAKCHLVHLGIIE